jgi:hypothetical protein
MRRRGERKRPRGAGSVQRHARGGWYIRWREGGRRRYASGFPTRMAAEHVLRMIVADVAAGRVGLWPDPKSAGPGLTIDGAAAVIAALLTGAPSVEDARATARAWLREFDREEGRGIGHGS